jgi:hypothetical protein
MSLTTSFEQLIELADKRDEVHFSFIKHILLMASGLLGILVSLHRAASPDFITHFSFALALLTLALGILFLTIALFAQVAVHKQQFLKWKSEVVKQLRDENYKPKPIVAEPSRFYAFCEKIGYFSFSISIVLLAIYGISIA